MTADFSGYATKNNLRCSDGRTILADAFKENDGKIVPLVWHHGHDDPTNVLGHVKLENRSDGVWAEAFFNSTDKGQHMKEAVKHGDVRFLSIFANQLIERAKEVIKGNIREVSLVLAGANPGATIEHVNLAHAYGGEDYSLEEAIITTGDELAVPTEAVVAHAAPAAVAEPTTETAADILETLNDKQKDAVYYLLSQALTQGDASVQHADGDDADGSEGAEDGADGAADGADDGADDGSEGAEDGADGTADGADEGTDGADGADGTADGADDGAADGAETATTAETEAGNAVQHANTHTQEDESMMHNVFDQARQSVPADKRVSLSHDDMKGVIVSTLKTGSLKTALEDYALAHGIENIEYLFPDAKTLANEPTFIARRMEWVEKVLNGVRKTPFSRIKTIAADITPDAARARGYVKGNMKNEEFFELVKRETTPQTVYKKQKLDRDDVLDITDLDVIAYVKAEMKLMLDEEIAGAILIGDGRSNGDEDKIREDKIRPVASDAELYVTTAYVNIDDANSSVDELIDSAIANRQYYRGTGLPTFYTTETVISQFLSVKDGFGRRQYASLAEVATVLRVADIVPIGVMERVPDVVGIMVNLADYSIGTDRGGQATMFDDFDLDYNKLRYLLETRLCGALTVPKSALVFRKTAASSALVTPASPAYNTTNNTLTVPTVSGVVYKNEAGDTLVTGTPVVVTEETSPYRVKAEPTGSRHFANNANDEWVFTYNGS